ncbi:MAG: PQQ-binding-like beta-propeller repeat protein [Pseudomonadota bacterium]
MVVCKGLQRQLSLVCICVLLISSILSFSTDVCAARQPRKRHFTSQQSHQRPKQYRRAKRYGGSDAYRRFKVKKDKISRLKKSSFWNKRPYQFSTPLIADGRLYVGVDAGVFYAFDVNRGKKLWKFKTKGSVQSKAAFSNGTVYFGDAKGVLYALDAFDGTVKWESQLDTEILAAPLILGSRLYIPSMSGRLYALDTATGVEYWHTPPNEREFGFSVRRCATPVAGFGFIYQGTSTGDVRAISQADGHIAWVSKLGSRQSQIYDVDSTPLLHENTLYVASADGFLYSLDPTNGSVHWASDAGGVGDIIHRDGRLYSTGGGNLYALDPATGLIFWSQDFEKPAVSSPAAGNGFITVVSTIDKIYVVESETGDIAYERYIRKGSLGDPVVTDDEHIYVLSNSGRLFGFHVKRVKPKEKKTK